MHPLVLRLTHSPLTLALRISAPDCRRVLDDEELWEVVVLLQIIKWDPEVFRLKKPAWRTVVSRL